MFTVVISSALLTHCGQKEKVIIYIKDEKNLLVSNELVVGAND